MSEHPNKPERLWLTISPEELEQFERWRGQQYPIPSKSEAVRYLLQRGLLAARDNDRASYDPGPRQKVKT
jgi:hypothetical protein